MSLWLTDDELFDLTKKRHRDKQIEVIAALGYQFDVREHDKFPLVGRWQFEGPRQKQRRRPAYAGG